MYSASFPDNTVGNIQCKKWNRNKFHFSGSHLFTFRASQSPLLCRISTFSTDTGLWKCLLNTLTYHWKFVQHRPAKLIRFTNPAFIGLLAMYPLGQAIGWYFQYFSEITCHLDRSWLAFQNATDASYYVQDFYFSHYNETITGWRVMRHWVVPPFPRFAIAKFQENDEFNARAFLIIFAAVLVMAVNFSIATFLASQTIVHLRQANAFTSNNKAKQMAILQALFAQVFHWD